MILPPDALSTVLVALVAGGVGLYKLPERVCPECPHCKQVQRRIDEQRAAERHDRLHDFGGTCPDPACERNPK